MSLLKLTETHHRRLLLTTIDVFELSIEGIALSDYHLFQSMAHGLAQQHLHSYEDAK